MTSDLFVKHYSNVANMLSEQQHSSPVTETSRFHLRNGSETHVHAQLIETITSEMFRINFTAIS